MKRIIGVVTTARSDWGIVRPILRAMAAEASLETRLYVTGMHLSPEFGSTVTVIEEEGFPIAERIPTLLSSDRPDGVAGSLGLGVLGFAQVFARARPDLLLVVGDRFDMAGAVFAALPFGIPVAHVHGGELTFGALDDALRHMVTKGSHLHFTSTAEYARRVVQLGEEPWRVQVSGAPALDELHRFVPWPVAELETRFGLRLQGLPTPPLLVTMHPETLAWAETVRHAGALLAALEQGGWPVIFTAPNADTAGRALRSELEAFVSRRPETAQWVENFGTHGYWSMLAHASAMVGNSSSGIIEAASFGLPVVNIGCRQAGRTRGINVIDVADWGADFIHAAIVHAVSEPFRQSCAGIENPCRAGSDAGPLIARTLAAVPLDARLTMKHFHNLPQHA